MAIYKLEEDPNVFIAPTYYGNKYVYRMTHVARGQLSTRRIIRNIDLRSDKLMIHGCEIKDSILQKLHDSLTLEPKSGHIYVNCNGACYIFLTGKGMCKPINNVIFDWSPFGIIVPNSVNDSLRKQLEEKTTEMNEMSKQLSSLNAKMSSTNSSLEVSRKETKELKEQLSTYAKERKDMEMELRKVCGRVSLMDFELQSKLIELETSKKEVKEMQDQLSTCRKGSEDIEAELQKARDQLFSSKYEMESINRMFELSKERVVELEEQLSTWKNESEEIKTQLQSMKSQLSSAEAELQSTKNELKTAKNNIEELQEVRDQLLSSKYETEPIRKKFELSKKRVMELEEQLSTCKKEKEDKETKLKSIQEDQLSSIEAELQTTKVELESANYNVKELKDQISAWESKNDHSSCKDFNQQLLAKIEAMFEKAKKENDQITCPCNREHKHREVEIQRQSDYLQSINSELQSTNRKLDQVLITMLLNQFVHGRRFQPPMMMLQRPSMAPRMLLNARGIPNTESNLPVFIEIEDVDEEI